MGISPGGDFRGAARSPGVEHGQIDHGPDAQRGAFGGIKGPPGAEEPGGVVLALADDALRLVKHVGPADLGDIPLLHPQRAFALVAGHMEPQSL